MKNEIKAKIESTKKFVHNHKTAITCTASAVVGAAAALAVYKKIEDRKLTLLVTDEGIAHMDAGGYIAYETEHGLISTRLFSYDDATLRSK